MMNLIKVCCVWQHWIELKCSLVQALRLCTGRMAHRGSRGIALLFLDHSTRRGWGVSIMPQLLFTPRKDLVPIVQEAGWAPGPVWTGAENLAHTRIWSPDRLTALHILILICHSTSGWPSLQLCYLVKNLLSRLEKIFVTPGPNKYFSELRIKLCHHVIWNYINEWWLDYTLCIGVFIL